jgi:hypothetical protein
MESSSLQRAVAASKKGAFEAIFAGGLDLSEFDIPKSSSRESAAKALLKVKARERQQNLNQEAEEARIQSLLLQQKQLQINKLDGKESKAMCGVTVLTSNSGGTGVSAALVGMHALDKRDPRHRLKRGKFTVKTKQSTQTKGAVKRKRQSKR